MSQLDSTEINFLKYCYFRLYHEQNKYCALRTCLLPILIYALPLNKGCGFTQLSLQVPRAGPHLYVVQIKSNVSFTSTV